MVFYTYLLLICFFVTAFLRYESGAGFVIITFCTVPGCIYVTCSKKTPVKAHGFCMTGCLFMIIAMYGLLPDGHNRLTDMFLTAMVIISLYQMVELNIFMLVSTEIYYLYALLSDHMQDASGGRDIEGCITDMIIILLGSLMLLVVIAWNKRLQIRLKQNAQEAEEAVNSESAFLANISHEIRTPLNAILGMNELVLRESRQPHIKEYAMYIKNSGKTLLTIISDILDLSKIESGILERKPEKFDLAKVCTELYTMIQPKITNPEVEFRLDNSRPDCWVFLDRNRLKQVWMNFLTNAVKCTSSGYVKMGYSVETDGIRIYVEDTGAGIPTELQDRVFGRFQKLNEFAQGTGLGLAISRAIVEAAGGKVGFASQPGVGSTFWAWLPCEIEMRDGLASFDGLAKRERPTLSGIDGKELRILIAEDLSLIHI